MFQSTTVRGIIESGPFAMSEVHHSIVALRISGDDLVPEEITAMLGASPTRAVIKGEKGRHIVGPKVGDVRVARSGIWTLEASDREPEDMNGQVCQILSQMTGDIAVWQNIVKRYRAELFCGLFLNGTYGGLTLSPQTLATLGERGIEPDDRRHRCLAEYHQTVSS